MGEPNNNEDDNPDFRECDGCGGTFYKGDLCDGLCDECQDALGQGDN